MKPKQLCEIHGPWCGWDHAESPLAVVGDAVVSDAYGSGIVTSVHMNNLGCRYFNVTIDDGRSIQGLCDYKWKSAAGDLLVLNRQMKRASTSSLVISLMDIICGHMAHLAPEYRWSTAKARAKHLSNLRAEIDRRVPFEEREP